MSEQDTPTARRRRDMPPGFVVPVLAVPHAEAARMLGLEPDELTERVRYGLQKPPRLVTATEQRYIVSDLGKRVEHDQAQDRTALYRAYASDGRLLYIGISGSALIRLSQHMDHSPWAHLLARLDVEWHATRAEALQAERDSIKRERPLFNVKHAERT